MVRIKICGITSLSDLEWAIECGADAVGFVRHSASQRYVDDAMANELRHAASPFVTSVAVYAHFGGDEFSADRVQAWTFPTMPIVPYIKTISTSDVQQAEEDGQDEVAESLKPISYLIDAQVAGLEGGTGHTVDWEKAEEIVASSAVPVILAGGLNPDNVAEAIRIVRPYGVDVASGTESSPGHKDRHKVKDFIDAVRQTATK